MAGDWIKIRSDLPNDPDVMRLSDILGTDDPTTVGHLVMFWAWADKQTTDGTDIAITSARLDRLIGRPGFAEALRQIGWLSGRDGSLCLPRFERHNGNSAKARAMEAEAKRLRRLEQKEMSDKSSDTCRTKPAPNVGPEKRREEEIRVEEKPPSPRRGKADELAETIWKLCPKFGRERSSQDQLLAALKKLPALVLDDPEPMTTSMKAWCASDSWTREDGKFVPGIHRWVKDGKWKSHPEPAKPTQGNFAAQLESDPNDIPTWEP